MNEYRVRTYEKGDETELVRLLNEACQGYAGLVPRTLECWRWSYLNRPDVEEEGIVVVVHAGRIIGYAVVPKSGIIWELCFEGEVEAATPSVKSDLGTLPLLNRKQKTANRFSFVFSVLKALVTGKLRLNGSFLGILSVYRSLALLDGIFRL